MEPKRAPNGRINISYNLENEPQEVSELPLRYMVVGDFTQSDDPQRLEDRKVHTVHRSNFDNVMESYKLKLDLEVDDTLSDIPDRKGNIEVGIKRLSDFEPDALLESIREQLPALDKALKLRDALINVKGSMTTPNFRRKLQTLIDDGDQRRRLMAELGMEP